MAEPSVAAGSSTPRAFSLPMIKYLASCNKAARDKSLSLLIKHLSSSDRISDAAMRKLWKALFYSLWHADKFQVQFDLVNRLSSLLLSFRLPLSLHYFATFLLTLRREWPGIDGLRLDKFYLLIRRFVNSVFCLLRKNMWDLELTNRLVWIFDEKLFLADDTEKKYVGNGVAYHVVSVFLEELKDFLPVSKDVIEVLFRPFFSLLSKCQDKVLVGKVKCSVFDFLLRMGRSVLEKRKNGNGGDDDAGDNAILNFGALALTMGFASKFYELGSSTDCFQGNRKVLFSLHEQFLKLEKDLEVSGIEISLPVAKIEDNDEVPELIPINAVEDETISSVLQLEAPVVEVEEGSTEPSKKKKKSKNPKKVLDSGSGKRSKVKTDEDDGNSSTTVCKENSLSNGSTSDVNNVIFDETFTSNLRMKFEKVADEEGMDKNGDSGLSDPIENGTVHRKRKKMRTFPGSEVSNADLNNNEDASTKSGEKSVKKVRFAMKNNLVWKPQSPLPPQSLRIPPSLTPRGSALKKGVPPGPVIEIPHPTKKAKQKKRGQKLIKGTSPAIKRLQNLRAHSAQKKLRTYSRHIYVKERLERARVEVWPSTHRYIHPSFRGKKNKEGK